MNKELKHILEKDIYRYYGNNKIPFKKIILPDMELKYIITYRKIKYYNENGRKLISIINKIKLKIMQYKYAIQIPIETDIGYGFYIGHLGRIIINPNVKIGTNVNIATGTTIRTRK